MRGSIHVNNLEHNEVGVNPQEQKTSVSTMSHDARSNQGVSDPGQVHDLYKHCISVTCDFLYLIVDFCYLWVSINLILPSLYNQSNELCEARMKKLVRINH